MWDYIDTMPLELFCPLGCVLYLLAVAVLVLFFRGAHLAQEPKLHPMYCVWPRCEGKETIAGWSPIEGSSGICPECAVRVFGKEGDDAK